MNPSKRNAKAKFLIHIGNGFLVDSYCVRLDSLEPPILGTNTPEDWIMELCHQHIYEKNKNDSCYYKSFIIELEVKSLTRAKKYDSSAATMKLLEDREKLWRKQNLDEKINPSKREK